LAADPPEFAVWYTPNEELFATDSGLVRLEITKTAGEPVPKVSLTATGHHALGQVEVVTDQQKRFLLWHQGNPHCSKFPGFRIELTGNLEKEVYFAKLWLDADMAVVTRTREEDHVRDIIRASEITLAAVEAVLHKVAARTFTFQARSEAARITLPSGMNDSDYRETAEYYLGESTWTRVVDRICSWVTPSIFNRQEGPTRSGANED